ncbi:MAG: HlyC/CorC family transporter [Verrucomicrobia bacterium]|nr:HlyC/CorC family transporter [Verrucomicrobiota bacterium]
MSTEVGSVAPSVPVFIQLGAVLALVGLNGFFVASEFAIVKVRASQLEALHAAGDRKARLAMEVTENLEAYLSATQLGITLASLALGWVGEPFVAALIGPSLYALGVASETVANTISVGVAFASITFLHIVLGELAPKTLAISKPVPTTLWVSVPLKFFYQVFRPAIWFLNGAANLFLRKIMRISPIGEHELAHSEEELRVILAESEDAKQVTPIGKEILINALDLRKRVVRDITTPRKEVIFLNTEDSFEENLNLAVTSRHTRFPVCEGHLDHAIGLVHIKDLMLQMRSDQPDLMQARRDILPVPEMMPLERLLTFFLTKHAHLALVLDEYGGTVGVVTLDNVLAEIVGDIQDEFDTELPEFKRVNADEFVVDGALALYELKDLAGLDLESEDVSTVGGYVTHLAGNLPSVGEQVRIAPFEVTVLKADGRRVLEVRFRRTQEEQAD